jgi:vancomycin resistance protein VanW
MKAYIKQAVPQSFIVHSKVALRYAQHLSDGSLFKFTSPKAGAIKDHFLPQIIEKQEIKRGELFDNKLSNIRLTASKISGIVIRRGAIFSFWHMVGNPSEGNGFQKSRIIKNGMVDFETGGGICQVSGLVYLAALKAGLKILERHNHSVDIYEEHERVSPLGADATVVYGSKDFQFMNNSDGDIQLTINVLKDDDITLTLLSSHKIEEKVLHFDRHEEGVKRIVTTTAEQHGKREQVAISVYKIKG